MYKWLYDLLELSAIQNINDYVLIGAIVLVISVTLVICSMFFGIFGSFWRKF